MCIANTHTKLCSNPASPQNPTTYSLGTWVVKVGWQTLYALTYFIVCRLLVSTYSQIFKELKIFSFKIFKNFPQGTKKQCKNSFQQSFQFAQIVNSIMSTRNNLMVFIFIEAEQYE